MKTRTTTQLVPHTIDGKTRHVPIKVDTPAPPRDWDQIVLNGVTGIAALVLTASVVWSTASIGDLLAHVVHPAAAYGAAVVFDLAWIACMAVEWLARYDADGAPLTRRAGRLSLLVAMGAVAAHGWLAGYLVIGIVGAVVSCLAKGLWTVVLNHQTPPLDERTRAWIHAELSEAGASLALVPVRRRLQRAHGLVDAERAALAAPDTDPGRLGQNTDTPDTDTRPDNRRTETVRAAVLAAAKTMPDADAEDIVDQLSAAGIDTDTDTVQDILHPDTDTRPDTKDSRSTRPPARRVRPIAPPGQTVADTIRTALASGITDKDAVVSYVRQIHGQDVSADTIARTRRRIEGKAS